MSSWTSCAQWRKVIQAPYVLCHFPRCRTSQPTGQDLPTQMGEWKFMKWKGGEMDKWLKGSSDTVLGTSSDQFSSVAQLCLSLCNPLDCSTPSLPEFTQTHVHWVGDAIQPSHPLSSPSPPAFNLSWHQGFFQGVSSSHQVAQALELQLQHQSFQWIFRTDFL